MKKHYIIILLLSSFFVQAQETTSGKTSISVDIAPLIVSPKRLSVGVAYQISPRFFVGIEEVNLFRHFGVEPMANLKTTN